MILVSFCTYWGGWNPSSAHPKWSHEDVTLKKRLLSVCLLRRGTIQGVFLHVCLLLPGRNSSRVELFSLDPMRFLSNTGDWCNWKSCNSGCCFVVNFEIIVWSHLLTFNEGRKRLAKWPLCSSSVLPLVVGSRCLVEEDKLLQHKLFIAKVWVDPYVHSTFSDYTFPVYLENLSCCVHLIGPPFECILIPTVSHAMALWKGECTVVVGDENWGQIWTWNKPQLQRSYTMIYTTDPLIV